MKYQSTRNRALTASPAEAVLAGIAPDGGLIVRYPSGITDKLTAGEISILING